MARRTERDKLASNLNKIIKNRELFTEIQAKELNRIVKNYFITSGAMNGKFKIANDLIKEKNPGRPPATSTNIFIETAPIGIELKLKRLLKNNLEYGNKVIPNFALGLEEIGLISSTAKGKEIFNYLKNLRPEPERELIGGSESNFYRILRDIRKDNKKERRKKDFWGKLIKEAL